MVRLTKITTKMGDKGTTMLGNGEFVEKCHPRINAYGTIDELGAHIGMVVSCGLLEAEMVTLLQMIQQHLFNLGSVLCRPHDEATPARHPITQIHIDYLETHIDNFNQHLLPLSYLSLLYWQALHFYISTPRKKRHPLKIADFSWFLLLHLITQPWII